LNIYLHDILSPPALVEHLVNVQQEPERVKQVNVQQEPERESHKSKCSARARERIIKVNVQQEPERIIQVNVEQKPERVK
jgi:hypothetical protein